MIKMMKMGKAYPNWYQMKEGIERIKMCGSDLRDGLFPRGFWSLRCKEEGEAAEVLVAGIRMMRLGLIPI